MIDFETVNSLTIPEGVVRKIVRKADGCILWENTNINQVKYSINSDGSLYNNGLGYKNGYRLSSSGAEKAQAKSTVTGFMPITNSSLISMSGVGWGCPSGGYSYIAFYDANFTLLATVNRDSMTHTTGVSNVSSYVSKSESSILTDENGVTTFNSIKFTKTFDFAYIRISTEGDGADMVVTIK